MSANNYSFIKNTLYGGGAGVARRTKARGGGVISHDLNHSNSLFCSSVILKPMPCLIMVPTVSKKKKKNTKNNTIFVFVS